MQYALPLALTSYAALNTLTNVLLTDQTLQSIVSQEDPVDETFTMFGIKDGGHNRETK
jgi:hypothetical protein